MSGNQTFADKVTKSHEEQDRDIVTSVQWKPNKAKNGVYAKFSPVYNTRKYNDVTAALIHLGIGYQSQMGGFEVFDGGV